MTDMSDSFSFIDDFLRDLEEFGTGAYLRADEKEFWDPPFDVSALPELKKVLVTFAQSMVDIANSREQANSVVLDVIAKVGHFYSELAAFNAAYEYAVIEPEEESQLISMVEGMCKNLGLSDEEISDLLEFE